VTEGIRFIEKSLQFKIDKSDNSKFTESKAIFEKSLAVNKDMKAGEEIVFNILEAKKPSGYGISAKNYKGILGKKIKNKMNKWDFLTEDNIFD
jgi:N-acetylneuraminate synthase